MSTEFEVKVAGTSVTEIVKFQNGETLAFDMDKVMEVVNLISGAVGGHARRDILAAMGVFAGIQTMEGGGTLTGNVEIMWHMSYRAMQRGCGRDDIAS